MQSLTEFQRADLFNSFYIMLEEAGARTTPLESITVITGILEDLAKHSNELSSLSDLWIELNNSTTKNNEVI